MFHAAWLEALRQVSVGIRSGNVVVLTGLPGVGKTSLVQTLLALLRQGGRPASLFAPDEPPQPDAVLVADDAHRLGEAALQAILQHPSACVLAGRPALAMLAAGLSRPVTTVTLHVLPLDAAAGFVAALPQEGEEFAPPFAPDAAARVQALGQGLPGAMAQVARSALMLAWERSAAAVSAADVEQAWAERAWAEQAGAEQADPGPAAPAAAPPMARVADAQPLAAAPGAVRRGRRMAPGLVAAALGAALAVVLGWPRRPDAPPQPARPALLLPAQPEAEAVPEPAPAAPAPIPAPVLDPVLVPVPAPLPVAVPLHVTLVVPPGAAELAAQVTGAVARLGYDVAGQRSAAVRSAALEVRYFYAEDAAAADRLAKAIGARPDAVRAPAPSPGIQRPPGAVEVVLPAAAPARPGSPSIPFNQGD